MRFIDRIATFRLAAIPLLVLLFHIGLPVAIAQGPAQSAQANAAAYLDELYRTCGSPSITVAVASKGRLVFTRAVGHADLDNLIPATPSTVYNIGSISKEISAVAVMQLVERGLVSLDDPIQKYVPSFPEKRWPVTIRHIMLHTSGIRHYRASDFPNTPGGENVLTFESIEDGIEIFKDDELLFEPGEYYHYSSYATNLLQGVVETVSGLGFEDYLREHVWGAAGMLHTGFDIPTQIVPGRAKSYHFQGGQLVNYPYEDVTYKFAGGGMISTSDDLMRFAIALTHGRLLKPETVDEMFTPAIEEVIRYYENRPPERMRFQQGLVWRTRLDSESRPYINAAGSVKGFNAAMVIYPEEDLIAVYSINADTDLPALGNLCMFADFFREAQEAEATDESGE